MVLTRLFTDFFNSEKASGLVLILCTAISLLLANANVGEAYVHLWHFPLFSHSLEFWINDGLMTIFFLLVGLEIERELYIGELSSLKQALLPGIAAVGGMIVPALIHFYLNRGTPTQSGFGIPMATDIAFSLGILSLLGNRVPASLKIFLTALAIIDDLGAILIIAVFYATGLSITFLSIAALIFAIMLILNRIKYYQLWLYLLLGCGLWYCLYRTGIHPTITGVLLAFAIPFQNGENGTLSHSLQHRLHKPVAFFILPLFALANTAISLKAASPDTFFSLNNSGIICGLIFGKPIGIAGLSFIALATGLCVLPGDVKKRHIAGAGLLAGIGFTMSIFITMLAFDDLAIINSAKIAVIVASVAAGILGFIWLRLTLRNGAGENDLSD